MDEETRREIVRAIIQHFFMKFDIYFVEHWCGISADDWMDEKIRQKVFKMVYAQAKASGIASKATMKGWFGIGVERKPTRKQFVKLALALHMKAEECNEYLIQALSEPELQVNDYQEYIAMYCMDQGLPYEDYQKMLEFFEAHYEENIEFRQTVHTEQLKKSYQRLKKVPKKEFLLWICQHMELFKGYSKVTYDCFMNLMEEVYEYIREDFRESLFRCLGETDFMRWAKERKIKKEQYAEAIPKFVKNALRRKECSEEEEYLLKEIRYFAAVAYASESNISQVVSELCRFDRRKEEEEGTAEFASTMEKETVEGERRWLGKMRGELKKMDLSYISNLLNVAEQKKRNLSLSKELWEADDESKGKVREKLRHQSQRVRQIGRKEILIPVQYIAQKKYLKEHGDSYDPEEAKKEFVDFADRILELCGMRKMDAAYELDYTLLQCYGEVEMVLFAEVLE